MTGTQQDHEKKDRPLAETTRATAQRIAVRDHIFSMRIGVTEEERSKLQRLCLNLTLDVEPAPPRNDDIGEVLSYGLIIRLIRSTCREGEYQLLESLIEALAARCFEYPAVIASNIRIEKLDRYADTAAVGVEIARRRID